MGLDLDELVARIGADLEKRGHVEISTSPDETDLVRSAGRRAARERGWKVRTFTVAEAGGQVRVFVVVTEADPLRQQLWDVRTEKVVREAVERISRDSP